MNSGQPAAPAAVDQPKRLNPSSTDQVLSTQAESRLIVDPSMRGIAAASPETLTPSGLVDTGPTETARAVAELNAQMWSDSASAAVEAPDGALDSVPDRVPDSVPDRVPARAASESEAAQLPESRSAPSEVAGLGLIPPPIDLEKAIAEAARAVGEHCFGPACGNDD